MKVTAGTRGNPVRMTPGVAVGLRLIVTLLFGVAGLLNLAVPAHRADLLAWGFPDGSQVVIGGAEWIGAAMLWHGRTRSIGYVALATIIAGACVTLLAVGLSSRLLPPVAYAIALALAAAADRTTKK